MKKLEVNDPGNQYGYPYMWGTAGIGYNVEKIKAIFGDTESVPVLEPVFRMRPILSKNSANVAWRSSTTRRKCCRSPSTTWDCHPTAMSRPITRKPTGAAEDPALRPVFFHASKYISDLANGNVCAVIGFNGDIVQAAASAREAKNGIDIAYSIPQEGSTLSFDMVVMPRSRTAAATKTPTPT